MSSVHDVYTLSRDFDQDFTDGPSIVLTIKRFASFEIQSNNKDFSNFKYFIQRLAKDALMTLSPESLVRVTFTKVNTVCDDPHFNITIIGMSPYFGEMFDSIIYLSDLKNINSEDDVYLNSYIVKILSNYKYRHISEKMMDIDNVKRHTRFIKQLNEVLTIPNYRTNSFDFYIGERAYDKKKLSHDCYLEYSYINKDTSSLIMVADIFNTVDLEFAYDSLWFKFKKEGNIVFQKMYILHIDKSTYYSNAYTVINELSVSILEQMKLNFDIESEDLNYSFNLLEMMTI